MQSFVLLTSSSVKYPVVVESGQQARAEHRFRYVWRASYLFVKYAPMSRPIHPAHQINFDLDRVFLTPLGQVAVEPVDIPTVARHSR